MRTLRNRKRRRKVVMATSSLVERFAAKASSYRRLSGAAVLTAAVLAAGPVHAQQPQSPPEGRIFVIGTGSVHAAPDYARITSGVTTRAKTVKEANDANSKLMGTITAALVDSGIAQADIQTSRFSIQPVYAPPQPNVEPKLSGYSVSNQVEVVIRQISKIGDILDRLVGAGATDIGNIAFLNSDPSKLLDQARESAVADARHKAELYARASGVTLGRVVSITEETVEGAPIAMARASARAASAVPIASGENTLEARITVGYEIAR
jgi:uncharacterized protein